MQITAEYLLELKQRVEAQKAELIAKVNQAAGFSASIDAMLERLKAPEPEPAKQE